ncbi:MAG: hypothetical protein RL518_1214 [Pseudomonadota bacterium]|jgi:hypothetical protein
MRKLLALVALVLLGMGLYESREVSSFLSRALTVQGTVITVETRTGPPKPTQNTPVHVRFALQSGETHTAITRLPLLQKVKEGDSIFLLVDPSNPQDVRLPLLSELWARPLAYLVSGIVLVAGILVVKVRRGEFGTPRV